MEQAVDAVTTVRLDHATVFRLRVLFYHISVVSEECAWFHELDSFIQAFPRSFHHAY
jgi:hypothetical protein